MCIRDSPYAGKLSQARDYYNSKLSDVVPDLYKLAWQMYAAERQSLADEIDTLAGLSDAA